MNPRANNQNRDKKKKKLTKDFNDWNKKILDKNVEPEPMDTSAQDEVPIPNSEIIIEEFTSPAESIHQSISQISAFTPNLTSLFNQDPIVPLLPRPKNNELSDSDEDLADLMSDISSQFASIPDT